MGLPQPQKIPPPGTGHSGTVCSLGQGAADGWGPGHDPAAMRYIPDKHPLPATYLLPQAQGTGTRLFPPASAEAQPG